MKPPSSPTPKTHDLGSHVEHGEPQRCQDAWSDGEPQVEEADNIHLEEPEVVAVTKSWNWKLWCPVFPIFFGRFLVFFSYSIVSFCIFPTSRYDVVERDTDPTFSDLENRFGKLVKEHRGCFTKGHKDEGGFVSWLISYIVSHRHLLISPS